MSQTSRRQFLSNAAGMMVAGSPLVTASGIGKLISSSQYSQAIAEDLVRYSDEIEATVCLIERTPRERCFATIVDEMNAGLPYRRLMGALFLAGIRNVDSAHVGGNLHTVFMVHSAHQLGLESAIDQRLLPMFWALDYFKRVQESGRQTRQMRPLAEGFRNVERPIELLEEGCVQFDADKIERALVTLVRTRGAAGVAEPLWRLAARDFIPLGHKAIYMANAWRTLQTIGWQYAEPTLRSLAYSLASFHGEGIFSMENQCYNENWKLARNNAASLPADWAGTQSDAAFVQEMVQVLRTGKHLDAAQLVVSKLMDGTIQAQSVWDAVHLAGGEIILRQSSIGAMHGITCANAIHYGFTQAAKPETRLLMLLQAVGFVCHFIPFLEERVKSRNRPFPMRNLMNVEPVEISTDRDEAIEQVMNVAAKDPGLAASRSLSFARNFDDHDALLRRARQLVYAKGDEAHDYKFMAAVFEDFPLVSSRWRPHLLAGVSQYFCASTLPDTRVMVNAKNALKRLG